MINFNDGEHIKNENFTIELTDDNPPCFKIYKKGQIICIGDYYGEKGAVFAKVLSDVFTSASGKAFVECEILFTKKHNN